MEKVNWKIQGMSCTNCALTVDKYLQGKGMQEVKVNFMEGDVSFAMPGDVAKQELANGIEKLGYQVLSTGDISVKPVKRIFKNHLQRFIFCGIFTAPLMLHMIPGVHIHFLMDPYVQLALTIPVFIVGMDFFGRSAIKSLLKGIPNMNVLIALGAIAAFGYSLYGTLIGQAEQYMFYESAATIITLVFLGNWMEDKSVEATQSALRKLAVSQKSMANMIAYDDKHEEHVFPVESSSLKVGDLLLIKSGEPVPMDCKILWGEASVNEAIITGESVPVEKRMNDKLIGGSTLENGTVKAYVTAAGKDTVLANILQLVKDAQTEKPPVQQLADRISAIFVPTVISIALLCFLLNYFAGQHSFSESLLRSIAVLVIACPCAMGLATPAAIAVGLGRAARNGVLFKNAKSLEIFRNIKQVVFDKTGTLTTGMFRIAGFGLEDRESSDVNRESKPINAPTPTHVSRLTIHDSLPTQAPARLTPEAFQRITYSLEKYSGHPIAKAIVKEWKTKDEIRWAKIKEIKGLGMKATDKEGNEYLAGSFRSIENEGGDLSHNVYVSMNGKLLGWIDVADEIRPEAKQVISYLQSRGIKTILLSGDRREKCEQVAGTLGIDEVIAEQTPQQKLEKIAALDREAPVAMVETVSTTRPHCRKPLSAYR